MSIVRTEITLKNAHDLVNSINGIINESEIRQITMDVLVDTGAWTLVINEEIRQRLGLNVLGKGVASLANGAKADFDMAGPVEIWWKDRRALIDALVLPDTDDVLLGAIPLEIMDLTINPLRELVGVHGDVVIHPL